MPVLGSETLAKIRSGSLTLGLGVHHLRGSAVPLLAKAARIRLAVHRFRARHDLHAGDIANLPGRPADWRGAHRAHLRGRAGRGHACARQRRLGDRRAPCRHRRAGTPSRRRLPLSADGASQHGRTSGPVRLSSAGRRRGTEDTERRDPRHPHDRDAGGRRECRQDRRHRRHRCLADRHQRPFAGDGQLPARSATSVCRQPIERSPTPACATRRCWGWAASTIKSWPAATSAWVRAWCSPAATTTCCWSSHTSCGVLARAIALSAAFSAPAPENAGASGGRCRSRDRTTRLRGRACIRGA